MNTPVHCIIYCFASLDMLCLGLAQGPTLTSAHLLTRVIIYFAIWVVNGYFLAAREMSSVDRRRAFRCVLYVCATHCCGGVLAREFCMGGGKRTGEHV